MAKSTVTRLFVAGIVVFIAGFVVALFGGVSAIASGAITIGGTSVVTVDGAALGPALGTIVAAGLVMAAGMLIGLIAWVGALVNTFQLEDKTWFVLLLILGLWSFGFVAMLAYVIAGPDGTSPGVARAGIAASPGG